jgi:hypothetical protein
MSNAEQGGVNSLQNLLSFLDELEAKSIYFTLARCRSEAIMVCVDVPGQRWEIEFFADGEVEVEIFRSTATGVVGGSEAKEELRRLLTEFADRPRRDRHCGLQVAKSRPAVTSESGQNGPCADPIAG